MFDLTLRFQHTPYGVRVSGPDLHRVLYLKDGHPGVARLHPSGEPVWLSDEVELFVSPVKDGVELLLKVHFPPEEVSPATRKAA
jgi:hypothetical protein